MTTIRKIDLTSPFTASFLRHMNVDFEPPAMVSIVSMPLAVVMEAEGWCIANITGQHTIVSGMYAFFEHEDEALQFFLRYQDAS